MSTSVDFNALRRRAPELLEDEVQATFRRDAPVGSQRTTHSTM